jgi:SAM-dependent methyltransferase
MSTMAENAEQIEYWNGASTTRWVTHQAALDQALRPFGSAAIERLRVRDGDRILDVGCGCGDTCFELAILAGPKGAVSGIDVSAALLARARERAPADSRVEFIEADAGTQPLGARFDALFSRFGVMFFADPTAAFRQLRAALVSGGRVSCVCWRGWSENAWATVPWNAARAHLPGAPATLEAPGPGPFAFADPHMVRRTLLDTRFTQVQLDKFDAPVVFSTTGMAQAVEFACAAGPVARLLGDASETVRAQVRSSMAGVLQRYRVGDSVALGGASWIVTAHAA